MIAVPAFSRAGIQQQAHPAVRRRGDGGGGLSVEIEVLAVLRGLGTNKVVAPGVVPVMDSAIANAVAVRRITAEIVVHGGNGCAVPLVQGAGGVNGRRRAAGGMLLRQALEAADSGNQLHIIVIPEAALHGLGVPAIVNVGTVAEHNRLSGHRVQAHGNPFIPAGDKNDVRVLLHGKIPLFSEIIAMQNRAGALIIGAVVPITAVVVAAVPGGAAEADGITMLGNGDIHHRRLAGLAIDGSRRQQALKLNPGEAVVLAGLIGPLVGLEVEEAARGRLQLGVVDIADNQRLAVRPAEPQAFILRVGLVDLMINPVHGFARLGVGVKGGLRHLPALLLVLVQVFKELERLRRIGGVVRGIKDQKIHPRIREHLHMAAQHPLIV